MVEDLWPEFSTEKETSPVDILHEQAAVLTKKTKHRVEGRVRTSAVGDKIESDFILVVPALGHYQYRLFTLSHGAISYPAMIRGFGSQENPSPFENIEIINEKHLRDILRCIFSDENTKRVITSLMAHSRAPEERHVFQFPAGKEA